MRADPIDLGGPHARFGEHESGGQIVLTTARWEPVKTRLAVSQDSDRVDGHLHVCQRCGCVFWRAAQA